jgi:hypothetical protein
VAYRVHFSSLANRQIAAWQLSDSMLMEVHIRLRRDLRENPAQALIRMRRPLDGLCYLFSMVDPENRLREHAFTFLVKYSQDEEQIVVVRGGYQRRDGL